ncbi:hypothetical protein WL049_23135 [Vibrio alginolyticus]|uniref:hypothetical protein n=1 Tax=Vibrio alginolyticus TaxID=663 RepID=UPI00375485CB
MLENKNTMAIIPYTDVSKSIFAELSRPSKCSLTPITKPVTLGSACEPSKNKITEFMELLIKGKTTIKDAINRA